MPRVRQTNKHLPRNMIKRGLSYYFVTSGKYTNLGRDYPNALIKYAGMIGENPNVHTVSDLLAHYIESRRGKLAKSTIENYLINAVNLGKVFGHMNLHDVQRKHVYQYVKTIGNTQANRDKALLSAAFTFALNIGVFTGINPALGLRERNTETPRDRYVTDAEYNALLLVSSKRLACMIKFLYLTGMRPSDVFNLKLTDFDDEGFLYSASKTKKNSGLVWSSELTEVVNDAKLLFRRFGRVYLFESEPKGKHYERGIGKYTVSGFRSLFKHAAKKAGLKDIRPYDC